MKVRLLFREDAAEKSALPCFGSAERLADLNLQPILDTMSQGDPLIRQVSARVLDVPLQQEADIRYRQEILKECTEKPELIRRLYGICRQAEDLRRSTFTRMNSPYLSTVYSSAAELLRIYMEALVEIRKAMEAESFSSPGLGQLSALLQKELSCQYLDQLRTLSDCICDQDGILICGGFGPCLQGVSYVKCQDAKGFSRLRWLLQPSYTLADRDMQGAKDLELRRDRAINEAANAMGQAADCLRQFTDRLRQELAFYVGCLNLYDRFRELGISLCYPDFSPGGQRDYQSLRDGSLALRQQKPVVGTDLHGKQKQLYLITGVNQGGKTTFLRSIGICQVLAQAGLFVCADRCRIPIVSGILTHFTREEDRKMDSGKLDEELCRMEALMPALVPGSLLLSNESFSSTNDRDGSQIFLGITQALLEQGVEIFSVTHLMGYAFALAEDRQTLSLLAERTESGQRTFRILEGKPEARVHGEELWDRVFA